MRRFGATVTLFMLRTAWVLVVLLFGSPAMATDPTPRELSAAADEDFRAHRWDDAAAKLSRAIAIQDGAAMRFTRGQCYEKMGRLAAALNDYEKADQLGGYRDQELYRRLSERRASVRGRVPTIRLRLPPDVDRASVTVDGSAVQVTQVAIPVDPGVHVVTVTAPGRRPYSRTVKLTERAEFAETIELPVAEEVRAGIDVEPAPVAPAEPRHVGRWVLPTLLGLEGAVAVGGGIVLGQSLVAGGDAKDRMLAVQGRLTVDSACDGAAQSGSDCTELRDAASDRSAADTRTVIGSVMLGAGVAGGVATLLLWKGDGQTRSVAVGAFANGLVIAGRFQ